MDYSDSFPNEVVGTCKFNASTKTYVDMDRKTPPDTHWTLETPVWEPMCEECGKRKAEKTDGKSRHVCLKCARNFVKPIHGKMPQGRNEKCKCGSGKKFKACCRKDEP